jgi:hypothetical protein
MEAVGNFSYRIETATSKTLTENGTRSIITGETGFTHSRAAKASAVVHDRQLVV